MKSGGHWWAGCLQPGFSFGRFCASEANEGPEWPPGSFCPCWRGGQQSMRAGVSAACRALWPSVRGAYFRLVSIRGACFRAGCSTSSSSTSQESPPRPPHSLHWGPLGPGLDGLPREGLGLTWARLCCRDYCCYHLLDLKASSCVLPPRGWL